MNQAEIDAARITWGCAFLSLWLATHKERKHIGNDDTRKMQRSLLTLEIQRSDHFTAIGLAT